MSDHTLPDSSNGRDLPGVFVDVGPVETGSAVGRIAEVIDFMPGGPEGLDHFWIVFVPPAGGDVDFCHGGSV